MLERSLGQIGLPSAYLAYAVEVGRGESWNLSKRTHRFPGPFPLQTPTYGIPSRR
jgi:hypothetical protein